MGRPSDAPKGLLNVMEGRTKLLVRPSGGPKGPASRGGVFFNPAMVQNRDLSVLLIDHLSGCGLLPGKNKRVLDGLCGSGVRAVRLGMETELPARGIGIVGTDLDGPSVEAAVMNASLNDVDVNFIRKDLGVHLHRERYSYIDIDPFGPPVPFLRSALEGLLNGGYMGVTATDTAALTGSVPRVSRRRYGITLEMTHAYQEISCRSLMGYIAVVAASMERGVEPVLFYSSDHFVRGYVRTVKGARRADRSLECVNWLQIDGPRPPRIIESFQKMIPSKGSKLIGPVWTGPLEDSPILEKLRENVSNEVRWGYLQTRKQILALLDRAISENGLPIMGYDLNEMASLFRTSPPSMEAIASGLMDMGRSFSRSRFSPTIFKTDGKNEEVDRLFREGGDLNGTGQC
ncbi:MAG: hypothetical protein JXA22_05955 [Candidatus Thermoplasmatota archaeon]|nr:hypothetical protein [Candidatus Thermoplasmatota archaeon]